MFHKIIFLWTSYNNVKQSHKNGQTSIDRSITWQIIWIWLDLTRNIAMYSSVSNFLVVKFSLKSHWNLLLIWTNYSDNSQQWIAVYAFSWFWLQKSGRTQGSQAVLHLRKLYWRRPRRGNDRFTFYLIYKSWKESVVHKWLCF